MVIIYVDGQNFLYRAAQVLIDAGVIRDKQELYSIDLEFIFRKLFDTKIFIKYYGVKKVRRRENLGETFLKKATIISDNQQRLLSYLQNTDVRHIEAGTLTASKRFLEKYLV